jgi:GNAT superfamily N-acetyltransferase
MEAALLRRVEEASLNAWPPLQQMLYDGWVLRYANGYTRRANSVNPVYGGRLPVGEKIGQVERLYRERGLNPTFRLAPLAQPEELDWLLEQAGYAYNAPTSVQALDLASLSPQPAPAVRQWEALGSGWLEAYVRMNGVAAGHLPALQGILTNIAARRCFMLLLQEDQPVACGLAVLETGLVGLFDIVTDPQFRGQGLGRQLVTSLLHWAKGEGAGLAYLQVMLDNAPALHLYGKLGFEEIYRYWYRVKEG